MTIQSNEKKRNQYGRPSIKRKSNALQTVLIVDKRYDQCSNRIDSKKKNEKAREQSNTQKKTNRTK